ncbi:MAG TPA: hypothetical protein VIV40_26025 [Kofleriaceae bacterium]
MSVVSVTTMFCDPAQIVNRKNPGQLDSWIGFVIASACFVTFMAVALGSNLVFDRIDRAVDRGWVPHGLIFITAFCVFVAWIPPARLSRTLRVAVLLPAVHALIVALAWPAWYALARFFNDRSAATALVTQFPIAAVAITTLAGFVLFALLVARRRSGEWLHGVTMLALSELLLLGLWVPISCALCPGGIEEWWTPEYPLVDDMLGRVLITVVPPTVIAVTFAAAGMIQPARLLRARRRIAGFVGVLFVVALITRLGASAREMVLYANLLPFVITAAVVAIASLMLFGAALGLRSYRAYSVFRKQRRSDGVIVDDDTAPALGFEITSWLRGPRIVQRPFAIAIAGATIPVRGAHLVAALPPATTQLKTGESYGVLRPGDRVMIAGHAAATGDPFRTSAAPLAGELFVAPAERSASGFTNVALAMWRPCVAYLLIVVAVAVPALAALAAT